MKRDSDIIYVKDFEFKEKPFGGLNYVIMLLCFGQVEPSIEFYEQCIFQVFLQKS